MGGPAEIRLTTAGQEAVVWPEVGGRVAAWRDLARDADLLAPLRPADLVSGAPLQGGCYTLAPYSNRIEGGCFRFQGREIRLPPHPRTRPHSLHGVAWRRPFRILRRQPWEVVLVLEHPGDEDWPWAFRLEQRVALADAGLTVEARLRNEAGEAQPAGLGFHPFFPRAGDPVLRFDAEGWWRAGGDRIPVALEPIPPHLAFGCARAVPEGLDEVFSGFAGDAELRWPHGPRLRLVASPALDHLVVFTPPGREVLCLEPVSHATNALNQPGASGVAVLEPGQELWGAMSLSAKGAPSRGGYRSAPSQRRLNDPERRQDGGGLPAARAAARIPPERMKLRNGPARSDP